jgi:hypothetical protein
MHNYSNTLLILLYMVLNSIASQHTTVQYTTIQTPFWFFYTWCSILYLVIRQLFNAQLFKHSFGSSTCCSILYLVNRQLFNAQLINAATNQWCRNNIRKVRASNADNNSCVTNTDCIGIGLILYTIFKRLFNVEGVGQLTSTIAVTLNSCRIEFVVSSHCQLR